MENKITDMSVDEMRSQLVEAQKMFDMLFSEKKKLTFGLYEKYAGLIEPRRWKIKRSDGEGYYKSTLELREEKEDQTISIFDDLAYENPEMYSEKEKISVIYRDDLTTLNDYIVLLKSSLYVDTHAADTARASKKRYLEIRKNATDVTLPDGTVICAIRGCVEDALPFGKYCQPHYDEIYQQFNKEIK